MKLLQKNLSLAGWALSLVTVSLAIIVWGNSFDWQFSRLSNYRLFPLLGLVAFSLMWVHYIIAALRKYYIVDKSETQKYFAITSYVVLVAILLHPGLLIYQLWADGLGLPPASYLENYVAESARWAVMLGTVSLVAFLLYELHRWYHKKSWWHYIQYASDVAMFGIFFHALSLGRHLQSDWYKYVWFFYGASLAAAVAYIYIGKNKEKT